jgi:hypothetical protein
MYNSQDLAGKRDLSINSCWHPLVPDSSRECENFEVEYNLLLADDNFLELGNR